MTDKRIFSINKENEIIDEIKFEYSLNSFNPAYGIYDNRLFFYDDQRLIYTDEKGQFFNKEGTDGALIFIHNGYLHTESGPPRSGLRFDINTLEKTDRYFGEYPGFEYSTLSGKYNMEAASVEEIYQAVADFAEKYDLELCPDQTF